MATAVVRRLSVLGLVAAAVVVGIIVIGGDEDTHRVSVVVPEAATVIKGQYVKVGGETVGDVEKVEPVDGGRAARIELNIEDRVWPLPKGTTFTLRWGGLVNFSNRYISLDRAPESGATIAENGTLPRGSFRIPVEFDGFLRTFDPKTRTNVTHFLDEAGPALREAKPGLRSAIEEGAPVVKEAASVFEDVEAEGQALDTLIRSGSRVLRAVQTSNPGIRELLSGASATFAAIASEEANLRDTLDRAPGTFRRTRSTLDRADSTLRSAEDLTVDLKPGIAELRRIARPLSSVLTTVEDVGPSARDTLRTARVATADINPLLSQLTGLAPQLGRIGKEGDEELSCIRPFIPDIISFFTNWGDFFSAADSKDKAIRATVQQFLPAPINASFNSAGDLKRLFGDGLDYGFPRPPGTNAGQPWYLPECGAGRDALDPFKDPEARSVGQNAGLPKLSGVSLRPQMPRRVK